MEFKFSTSTRSRYIQFKNMFYNIFSVLCTLFILQVELFQILLKYQNGFHRLLIWT